MRIAHIITRMIVGGAQENTLFNCVDLHRDFGDEVVLITGPALGPEGDLLNLGGEESGVQVEIVDSLRRSINPLRDVQAYSQIRKLIQEFGPDVVHTHSAKAGVLGRAAAWNLGVSAILHTVHGAPFHEYQSRFARQVFQMAERWAARRCHHMISVADAMTDLMVKANVAEEQKFSTIYSGMDVDPFLNSSQFRSQMRADLGIGDEHIVIGKIARLFHLKGHEDIIQAAKAVVARYPNVRFLFVGDGLLREQLDRQIKDSELGEYFCFTGLVDPSEIPKLIAAMDILAHASYREGLARALPQALISGVPAISYDIDGAREVVLNEITGLLVPAGDINGLSDAMLKLVQDSAHRKKLGAEGKRRFADRFRHQVMTSEIRGLYVKLLESKHCFHD